MGSRYGISVWVLSGRHGLKLWCWRKTELSVQGWAKSRRKVVAIVFYFLTVLTGIHHQGGSIFDSAIQRDTPICV